MQKRSALFSFSQAGSTLWASTIPIIKKKKKKRKGKYSLHWHLQILPDLICYWFISQELCKSQANSQKFCLELKYSAWIHRGKRNNVTRFVVLYICLQWWRNRASSEASGMEMPRLSNNVWQIFLPAFTPPATSLRMLYSVPASWAILPCMTA